MAAQDISLTWSGVFKIAPKSTKVSGDKILLPQSALQQLLSVAPLVDRSNARPVTPFDPFNPYSLAAARAEQAQYHDTHQQLPHPLTFRLVNSYNGNVVYAGIREFSAEEGEIGLSPFLFDALGIKHSSPNSTPALGGVKDGGSPAAAIDLTGESDMGDLSKDEAWPVSVTVHAKQLPKGTYVRLRPLEAGYNPEDWKALLERHFRENFTTLTNGEMLSVKGARSEEFRFLIDKVLPNGDGICVVDTDLEVDIEALNEEQARETMKQIMKKAQKAPGLTEGSSIGGNIDVWKPFNGQVLQGEYVDFVLPSWDKSQGLDIELTTEDDEDVDLLISPYSTRQRVNPRIDEHVWGDFSTKPTKRISIQPSNIGLDGAEALFISAYAHNYSDTEQPQKFSLRVKNAPKEPRATEDPIVISEKDTEMHGPEEEQCKNCHQWVPKRTMMLHENFCLRNNILCPHCENVFQKKSQEWQDHWHCPHDSEFGNTPEGKEKHGQVSHTLQTCPNCSFEAPNLKDLALHRTSVCPGKIILCQFCHLDVPQEGEPFEPSPEAIFSGLTEHELQDGARTTECDLCSKRVRLRDMATHLKHHEFEKSSRSKPAICRNVYCGRTLEGVGKNGEIGAATRMGQGPGNDLGLCSICFGPLYVSMHDPEGKAMKRRVERRYISQLIVGCGKAWCTNEVCKTAKSNIDKSTPKITTKDALSIVKPLVDGLTDHTTPMYFCADEASQRRRKSAELLAAEKVYDLEWCIAGCEVQSGNLDGARQWLQNWAPKK